MVIVIIAINVIRICRVAAWTPEALKSLAQPHTFNMQINETRNSEKQKRDLFSVATVYTEDQLTSKGIRSSYSGATYE